MPDRQRLVFTLRFTSSLALLVLVLVASIRLPGLVTVSPRPDRLRENFTRSPGQPATCLSSPATATNAVRKLKALHSEQEEEEGADALVEPRVSFLSLCAFREAPERQLTVPHSILSLFPLRC